MAPHHVGSAALALGRQMSRCSTSCSVVKLSSFCDITCIPELREVGAVDRRISCACGAQSTLELSIDLQGYVAGGRITLASVCCWCDSDTPVNSWLEA